MKTFLNYLSHIFPRMCTTIAVTVYNKKGYQITFTKTFFGVVISEDTYSVKDLAES